MVRRLILLLSASVLFPIAASSHQLPYVVDWKSTFDLEDGSVVKSETELSWWQKNKISYIYWDIHNKFDRFEPRLNCDGAKPVEIRIVDRNILHNRKIFAKASHHDFGRYFPDTNYLYILPEFMDHPEYLAHEIGHYKYDECNKKFDNAREEHIMVYRFQYFYGRQR